MWYRQAIDLSNLKSFSPIETSVSEKVDKPLTEGDVHKSLTNFHESRDEIDNVLQFGGLDVDSPFIVEYAEQLLGLIGDLVPALEGILGVVEQGHALKWINFILLRFTSANWIIEDTRKFVGLCNRVKVIEDPRERIKAFISGIRKIDGLYGFLANSIMIFNTIAKGLKEFANLDINNKWTFMAYFYGAPIAKYLFEESGDDEDKSGLKIIKKRVINPSLEFLFEKNNKNRVVYNYVMRLMKENPDYSHDEILNEALGYFDISRDRGQFRDLPGSKINPKDISEIVDLVYEDPHDVMGVLRGRRISKTYYDSFVSLMSNSGVLQSQCLKASIAISQMLSWLSHVKIASKNNWTKMG